MRLKQYLDEQNIKKYKFKDKKASYKFVEWFRDKGKFPYGHVDIGDNNTILVPNAVIARMPPKKAKEMEALYKKLNEAFEKQTEYPKSDYIKWDKFKVYLKANKMWSEKQIKSAIKAIGGKLIPVRKGTERNSLGKDDFLSLPKKQVYYFKLQVKKPYEIVKKHFMKFKDVADVKTIVGQEE